MQLLPSPAILLLVAACAVAPETPTPGGGSAYVVPTEPDCVPTEEVPNDLVDQDCDGQDRIDRDLDGHSPPWGSGEDCDDTSARARPLGVDVCGDGLDDDCDGAVDAGRRRADRGVPAHAAAMRFEGRDMRSSGRSRHSAGLA